MIGQMKENCWIHTAPPSQPSCLLLDVITTLKPLLLKLFEDEEDQMACQSGLLVLVFVTQQMSFIMVQFCFALSIMVLEGSL